MVRSTNTGITTIIDPTGEIRDSLPIFAEGVLEANVPLMEIETFYSWAGDWFAFLVTAMAFLAVARGARAARTR